MIEEIIEREWEFFGQVQNIGGRAFCQDDFETFQIQRTAQFKAYDHDTLASYIQDLRTYTKINYNPMMLKYARMMASSDSEYYETIKDQIPSVDDMTSQLIETIVSIEVSMKEEFNKLYPNLALQTRKIYSYEDQKDDVSFETYLRGELSTYSSRTIYLYGNMLVEMIKRQENMIIKIQEETVKAYGYQSLEDANRERCE